MSSQQLPPLIGVYLPEYAQLPAGVQRERLSEELLESVSDYVAFTRRIREDLIVAPCASASRRMGGDEFLAAAVVDTATYVTGMEVRAGVAQSLLAVILAAQEGCLVPPGRSADFLAGWPLSALREGMLMPQQRAALPPMMQALQDLGVTTLGAYAHLPRLQVQARFGSLGVLAHELASGDYAQLPAGVEEEPHPYARMDLDPPVTRSEQAAFAAKNLAHDFSQELLMRGLWAPELSLTVTDSEGRREERQWTLGYMASEAELTDRLRWQLDALMSGGRGAASSGSARAHGRGFSPGGYSAGRDGGDSWEGDSRPGLVDIARLQVTAERTLSSAQETAPLWAEAGDRSRRRMDSTLARLDSLLPSGSLRRPRDCGGWDPRTRIRVEDWSRTAGSAGRAGATSATAPVRAEVGRTGGQLEPGAVWRGQLPPPYPSYMPTDERIVELFDARRRRVAIDGHGLLSAAPAVLHGSGYEEEAVVAWAGPWVVDDYRWSSATRQRRAYLQLVLDQSAPVLLKRCGRWMVDGVYA